MDYVSTLIDSIDTSVSMKIFRTRRDATDAHVFKSQLMVKFPMAHFKTIVDNFNPDRLKPTAVKAYPLRDRPRGQRDIKSVKFHQRQIQRKRSIEPIWLVATNGRYILLDGAHRIVASHIERKKTIPAYIIN